MLLDNSFYVEIFLKQPTLKLQKELSQAAHIKAARSYEDSLAQVTDDVNESDVIMANSESASANILRAPLSCPANRMAPITFITWMRFYLSIPQQARIGNAKFSDILGYEAEQCLHLHGEG
jgi:hypothetical protein